MYCKRFICFIVLSYKVGQLLAAIMGSQNQQVKRKPSPVKTAVAPAGIERNEKLDTVLLNEVEGISEKGENSSPEKEDSGQT